MTDLPDLQVLLIYSGQKVLNELQIRQVGKNYPRVRGTDERR